MVRTIGIDDFARSFGTTAEALPEECKRVIAENDFSYRTPTEEERDRIILEALRKSENDTQVIGAPERQQVWQKGWEENLNQFVSSGYKLESLVPRFIRPGLPIRFNGNYLLPTNPMFELAFLSVFRIWIFKKYFSTLDSIYEFGCGTGFNLVEIAQLFPQKTYFGLDFVPASASLIDKIGEVYGWKMTGGIYDFRNPDRDLTIPPNSGVFTFGALEQVADDYEPFLEHLMSQQVSLCINIEPTLELYDQEKLFDYLAIRFHRKRGYTSNYLTRLRILESESKIKILQTKRLFFGSQFMEGYTYVVWKPIKVA